MPVTYTKLFHMLLDRGIKKGELQEQAEITASIMARLAKNETVRTDTIGKICKALDCQPGDIMQYDPDPTIEDIKGLPAGEAFIKGIEVIQTTPKKKRFQTSVDVGKQIGNSLDKNNNQ